MKENLIFHINKLYCSYNKQIKDTVLYIEDLKIPKDKIVFLLGASGCGKSTLLETLGLMNDTIASGSLFFFEGTKEQPQDISTLWKEENSIQLNEVRKKHYSFIFQNTNLMENFTAYENVCLSAMIKDNVQQKEVLPEAKRLMEKIKLPENEVGLDTLAVNLSGGQRQRLAFARAFNNSATVLFGDEPTGNLDEANANELFEIIRSNLHEGLSAIIVSHDINLAVKYADEIIVLTKDLEKGIGEIKPSNIFRREDWVNNSEGQIFALKNKIRGLYQTAAEHKINNSNNVVGKVNTDITYNELFLGKEGRVMFGKNFQNLIILATILFFTFLSIGFANGSLAYLKKKMDNPFVRWITIPIPAERSKEAPVLSSVLSDTNAKLKYNYQKVTQFAIDNFYGFDYVKKDFFSKVKSRSFNFNDDANYLNEVVLAPDNLVYGKRNGFNNERDLGVIVSESFLSDLHYPTNSNFILARNTKSDSNKTATNVYYPTPIPIIAIVKKLPDVDVIYTDNFANTFMVVGNPMFDITKYTDILTFFAEGFNKDSGSILKQGLEEFFKSNSYTKNFYPLTTYEFDTIGHKGGVVLKISFDPRPNSFGQADSIATFVKNFCSEKFSIKSVQQFYDYATHFDGKIREKGYDQFSVYFDKLDKVRSFKTFFDSSVNDVGQDPRIEVNVTKVDEKENFYFLSQITKSISFLLVIFCLLSTSLFLSNLLKGHLSKVRMNIGTFQAIGLANRETLIIYFKIILKFIIIALAVSLICASIIGSLVNIIWKSSLQLKDTTDYFKIFDINTGVTILAILISAFIISWKTINKMLNKTPGDLIYNR